jgi:hypothetical protein
VTGGLALLGGLIPRVMLIRQTCSPPQLRLSSVRSLLRVPWPGLKYCAEWSGHCTAEFNVSTTCVFLPIAAAVAGTLSGHIRFWSPRLPSIVEPQ